MDDRFDNEHKDVKNEKWTDNLNEEKGIGVVPSMSFSAWDDELEDMTLGRRWARKLCVKYAWYFPGKDARDRYENGGEVVVKDEVDDANSSGDALMSSKTIAIPPSLDNAWAYFEHFVLPRYYTDEVAQKEKSKKGGKFVDEFKRSDLGEVGRASKLYPIWKTSENDLSDFGIGIGLYFYTLKAVAFILFIAGCLNIVNMVDFSSDSYADDAQESVHHPALTGSAVCTDMSWEACPSCSKSDWDDNGSNRFASTDTQPQLNFVLVNQCNIGKTSGWMGVITLGFIILAMLLLNHILKKKSVAFDESMQTAPDYSIVISNPPPDARDPHEWKAFFEAIDPDIHVTLCTIALNNEELLRPLVKRRQLLLQIQNLLPPHIDFQPQNLQQIIRHCPQPSLLQKIFCFSKSPQEIYEKIQEIEAQVEQLSQLTYECCDVYITFETEQAQRLVLQTMTTSIRNANTQTIPSNFPEKCLFRQNYLLRIREPDEPSSIRWMDLNESDLKRLLQRVATFSLSACLLVGCAYAIFYAKKRSALAASLTITCFNQITPLTVKFLNSYEAHATQSSYQASQFIKITLFRWTNTAIITQIITPFTDTIQNDSSLIYSIFTIFLTEMTVNPILQLSNYMSNIKRHILAPKAADQRRMNLYFKGAYYEIGERYTAMTKVLFFTLFYCTIFPLGFFFATAILVITYWTDKYSLLRTWMVSPLIGSEVSDFTRKIFFPLAALAYAIIGSYQYASFPFDNVCDTGTTVPGEYVSSEHAATTLDGKKISINIGASSVAYKRCDQANINPLRVLTSYSEETPWMTSTQEDVSEIYGWVSLIAIIVVGSLSLIANFKSIHKYFFKVYQPVGDPTDQKFCEQDDGDVIDAYIPQLNLPGFSFPTLLCNVDGLDSGLIGWSDPDNSYDTHNMVFDVPKTANDIEVKRSFVEGDSTQGVDESRVDVDLFSTVHYWAPEPTQKL